MITAPATEAFRSTYDSGAPQVVWTTLGADLETPVSAYYKLKQDGAPACLMESVVGGNVRNQFSFIGLAPDLIWRSNGDKAEMKRGPDGPFEAVEGDTITALRALIRDSLIPQPPHLPPELPPMAAGLIGYLGYEFAGLIEDLPTPGPDPVGAPETMLMRPTVVLVFDSVRDEITLVTPVRPENAVDAGDAIDADEAYSAALARLDEIVVRLKAPLPAEAFAEHALGGDCEIASNTAPDDFRAMVATAKDYIEAGDIFQVVLSQRFSTSFEGAPFSLYRRLRRMNPSPFLFFLDFEDMAIVGSSPEVMVRVRDNEVMVRPIAGTRPRGKTEVDDAALADELLADPKELAEHLMLVDLGRNDVGRVSVPGTVKVTEQNVIERYSHVMHIVSNVTGELDPEYDAFDALAAGFPVGTVSGAPKIRAMEIIAELEPEKRGIYAGAVGYFSADGSMDSCIALRTAIVKDGQMYVQAGAGIVWDSDPESELQECRNKAQTLFAAAKTS